MQTKNFIFACLAIALAFTSCTKDDVAEDTDRAAAEKAAQEYLLAETMLENAFKLSDTQAKQQGDLNGFDNSPEVEIRNNCPEIGFVATPNTLFPATLTLDFADGCEHDNGAYLSGRIVTVYNGLLLSAGTSITMSFEDFTHNGNALNGTYQLANDGPNAAGEPTFSANVVAEVIAADGRVFNYQAVQTTRQTVGINTNFFTNGLDGILDDVWTTERTSSFSTSEGFELEVTTSDPILSPIVCRWPVSGQLSLDFINPATTGSIDFGDGSCDNKALLTIGTYSVEIDL